MKKGFVIALLLLFVTCFASSQSIASPKGKIPKGQDEADFINAYIQEKQQKLKSLYYDDPTVTYSNNVPIKFSKTEKQRIWDALDKYELEKDELYGVIFSLDDDVVCDILVKISEVYKDGTFNYSWWGICTVYKRF